MGDEEQEEYDMESAHHQQQLEARRREEGGAGEVDLLAAWYEWCEYGPNVPSERLLVR